MPKKIRHIRVEGNTAYITLTKGYVATIDAEDVCLVNTSCWFAKVSYRSDGSIRTVYAQCMGPRGDSGKQTTRRLHRVILGAADGDIVDHADCNGLNNKKYNLRFASFSQNCHNQRIHCNNTSGAKGVHWHKRYSKWTAQIKINGARKHLGYFHTASDAAMAYQKASDDVHASFSRY